MQETSTLGYTKTYHSSILLLMSSDWDCTENHKLTDEQQNQHMPQTCPAHHPPSSLLLTRSCSSAGNDAQVDAHHLLPIRPRAGCAAPWSDLVCTNPSHQNRFRVTSVQHKCYRLDIHRFSLPNKPRHVLTCCCTAHVPWQTRPTGLSALHEQHPCFS